MRSGSTPGDRSGDRRRARDAGTQGRRSGAAEVATREGRGALWHCGQVENRESMIGQDWHGQSTGQSLGNQPGLLAMVWSGHTPADSGVRGDELNWEPHGAHGTQRASEQCCSVGRQIAHRLQQALLALLCSICFLLSALLGEQHASHLSCHLSASCDRLRRLHALPAPCVVRRAATLQPSRALQPLFLLRRAAGRASRACGRFTPAPRQRRAKHAPRAEARRAPGPARRMARGPWPHMHAHAEATEVISSQQHATARPLWPPPQCPLPGSDMSVGRWVHTSRGLVSACDIPADAALSW